MFKAVELVERHGPRRALWVVDSGGDRSRLHRAFKQLGLRYLVRVKRARVVSWHGARQQVMAVYARPRRSSPMPSAKESPRCGPWEYSKDPRSVLGDSQLT